jgi:hypothetical protein
MLLQAVAPFPPERGSLVAAVAGWAEAHWACWWRRVAERLDAVLHGLEVAEHLDVARHSPRLAERLDVARRLPETLPASQPPLKDG